MNTIMNTKRNNRQPVSRLFFGSIDADVFAAAALYMGISALSYPFLAVYNASAAIFRVMNNAKITLKVTIVMNLINVAGNAIGIFVLHSVFYDPLLPGKLAAAGNAVDAQAQIIIRIRAKKCWETLPATSRLYAQSTKDKGGLAAGIEPQVKCAFPVFVLSCEHESDAVCSFGHRRGYSG